MLPVTSVVAIAGLASDRWTCRRCIMVLSRDAFLGGCVGQHIRTYHWAWQPMHESGPLRAAHVSRHKWPGGHGLGEGICCPLNAQHSLPSSVLVTALTAHPADVVACRLRRSLCRDSLPSSLLLSSLELSDATIFEPSIRALP